MFVLSSVGTGGDSVYTSSCTRQTRSEPNISVVLFYQAIEKNA